MSPGQPIADFGISIDEVDGLEADATDQVRVLRIVDGEMISDILARLTLGGVDP